jgi:uncharacterized protein
MSRIKVAALAVYPVKSLGSIPLTQVALTDRGFRNDRRWMVVNERDEFVTQRDFPKMATIWVEQFSDSLELASDEMDEPLSVPFHLDEPAFELGASPAPLVKVWSATVRARYVSAAADAWLSECLGQSVKLVYMPDESRRECSDKYAKRGEIVSFADGYPFLLTSEASLADLNRRIRERGGQAPLPMSRFRSNIVVDGGDAWAEDSWREIKIGEHTFYNVKPCARCQVTTTDQATGEVRGPEPLATLGTFRDSSLGILFGVNLTCASNAGEIKVGDSVDVVSA